MRSRKEQTQAKTGRGSRRRSFARERNGKVLFIVLIFVVALFAFGIVYFFGHQVVMRDNSMKSTLQVGDRLLVNRLTYMLSSPEEGDVVVFTLSDGEDADLSVKRVVAVAGDTVTVLDGVLYVDEEAVDTGDKKVNAAGIPEEGLTVPSDSYFVLGDNPTKSEDSRYTNVGCITKEQIVGQVWLKVNSYSGLSFERIT